MQEVERYSFVKRGWKNIYVEQLRIKLMMSKGILDQLGGGERFIDQIFTLN